MTPRFQGRDIKYLRSTRVFTKKLSRDFASQCVLLSRSSIEPLWHVRTMIAARYRQFIRFKNSQECKLCFPDSRTTFCVFFYSSVALKLYCLFFEFMNSVQRNHLRPSSVVDCCTCDNCRRRRRRRWLSGEFQQKQITVKSFAMAWEGGLFLIGCKACKVSEPINLKNLKYWHLNTTISFTIGRNTYQKFYETFFSFK